MTIKSNTDDINKSLFSSEDEVDLINLFKLVLRQKKFVLILSALLTSFSVIYSGTLPSKWSGNFQIIVKDKSNDLNQSSNQSSAIFSLLGSSNIESDNLTQLAILKSQSVLLPVFEYAKNQKELKGKNVEKLTYKKWLNSHLDIEFEKGTSVLNISYKGEDKDEIRSVLNLISSKYQDYSLRDRKRNLNQVVNFLEKQIVLQSEKSKKSFEKLNAFSLKHGLGNLDGLIGEEDLTKSSLNKLAVSQIEQESISSGAGQRYSSLFKLLQEYETTFAELSSKLKPESELMIDLNLKIQNLKSSLKRPNEILLKYRDIKRDATRNEILLSDLMDQLSVSRLEKAKQAYPWELISSIVIDDVRLAPNRKNITILSLIFSTLFSSVLAIIYEKRKGVIFDIENFRSLIPYKNLGIIYEKDHIFNLKKIQSLFDNQKDEDKIDLGIICASSEIFQEEKKFTKLNLFKNNSYKSLLFLNPLDYKQIDSCQKLLLVVEDNCITYSDLKKFLNYVEINEKKVLGWMSVIK